MKTRIISGFFLLVILGALLYFGGRIYLAALAAVSLIGVFEYCRALKAGEFKPYFPVMISFTVLWYLLLLVRGGEGLPAFTGAFLVLAFLVLMVIAVFSYPGHSFTDAALCLFGLLYVPLMFSFLFMIRERADGLFMSILLFLAAWGSDVFAYLAGRFFGKRKLAPELSPKKTVAGALGGMVGSMALCLLFTHFTASLWGRPYILCMLFAGLFGALGGAFGQLGDLFASSLKRMTGIKDFGKLIPGHGGILDRFDSVLSAAPLMMLALYILDLI